MRQRKARTLKFGNNKGVTIKIKNGGTKIEFPWDSNLKPAPDFGKKIFHSVYDAPVTATYFLAINRMTACHIHASLFDACKKYNFT